MICFADCSVLRFQCQSHISDQSSRKSYRPRVVVNIRPLSPRTVVRLERSDHPRHSLIAKRACLASTSRSRRKKTPSKSHTSSIPNSPPSNAQPRFPTYKSNARLALLPRAATNTITLPPTRIPAQDSVATFAPQRQHPRQWQQRAPDIHERRSEQAAESFSGAVREARNKEGACC